MHIRPLRPSDLEPLHIIYTAQAALMPRHPIVGLEQFAAELTQTRHQKDEHWDPATELVLVAEKGGEPAAFAHASFLLADARHCDLKAGDGMIRFAFASAEHADVLRALIHVILESSPTRELRAFAGYAPLFHNCGQSAVSNAWPWVSRALVQEGFTTLGRPVLAMLRPLDTPLARLPLPEGATLRYDWVTRIGERDSTEGGYHVLYGEDRAAESMWHFGEKYVRGSGHTHAQLFWLGTNEPYRGRGLGRFLLRETLVTAQEQGARESSLRCNYDNFYAHALYRAEGYEPNDILWTFKHPLQ